MTITEILDHTSQADKENMLRSILELAFPEGKIDPAQLIGNTAYIEIKLWEETQSLASQAQRNLCEIKKASKLSIEEGGKLGEMVHDHFSSQSTEINCSGTARKIHYLICELGFPAVMITSN